MDIQTPEPTFRVSGASNPRQPHSSQNTGEFINELRKQCNCIFELGMCLRVWKQKPFHSASKDSLETCHPPSHQPLPSPRYAPHKVAWPHPARGGPWRRTLPLCREVKAGNERPRGGRPEPAFRSSGASNPRQPRCPQNTGELTHELRQRRQKSRF